MYTRAGICACAGRCGQRSRGEIIVDFLSPARLVSEGSEAARSRSGTSSIGWTGGGAGVEGFRW